MVFHYYGRRVGGHLKCWAEACGVAGLPGLRFYNLRVHLHAGMEGLDAIAKGEKDP